MNCKKTIASFLSTIFLSLSLSAQDIDLHKMSEDQVYAYMETESMGNTISEACGVGGAASLPYLWTTACIRESKINLVRKLIYSKNPAVQFLASLLCETMEKEGMISLSTIEKEAILQIKKSDAKVSTCSGCTYFASISLSGMYNCTSGICVVSEQYRMWADSEVKKYADRKRTDEKMFTYLQDSIQSSIGFGCGYSGAMTGSVVHLEIFMQESKIGFIRSLLYSHNPSVQYLSAQLCESLQEENQIVMTKEEKKEIVDIRASNTLTKLCAGCTYQEEVTMNNLSVSEDKEISKFRRRIKLWADQEVKEYKKALKGKK